LTSIADNDHLFKEFLKKQANVFGCFFVDKKTGQNMHIIDEKTGQNIKNKL